MQNAIDSQTDGNLLSVSYSSGLLTIQNEGCILTISDLVLGNTGKHDDKYIGTYGEGFKLALVVLLRNGLDVTIYTNNQRWEASFRKSRKFKVETLHIDVYEDISVGNGVSFTIDGLQLEDYEEIRDRNLAMRKALGFSTGLTIESEYGDILLEKRYKGMMFVNGLYVQTDNSFKYGYDFKPKYLHLDRDRKAINYYKLRELTAKAVTSQMNMKIVTSAMSKHAVDVKDVVDNLNEISKEFKVNFANDLIKRHELDEDTFVGLEKEVNVSKREKYHIVDSKAVAELVNSGLNKEKEYREIKERVKTISKEETAQDFFEGSDFEKLLTFLIEHKESFTEDERQELKEIIDTGNDYHTYYFDLIKDNYLAEFDD
jgi:hypothetical protein